MVNFEISEEINIVRKSLRAFIEDEIAPLEEEIKPA